MRVVFELVSMDGWMDHEIYLDATFLKHDSVNDNKFSSTSWSIDIDIGKCSNVPFANNISWRSYAKII
jgi:hypothetical protein